MYDFVRVRELVHGEGASGSERGWLGTHAVLGPEAGEKHDFRKVLDRFKIRLQPYLVVREIVEYGDAVPVRQPWTVDDEPGRQMCRPLPADCSLQKLPLSICHMFEPLL